MNKGRVYRGFSLIEVIVSSALVATTMGALFSAASLSTRLTILGQERVVASQLAREGLEVAKNVRDQNFINQRCIAGTPSEIALCADWRNGLLTSDELSAIDDRAITKRVAPSTTGYTLETVDLGVQTCTDYISRETMLPNIALAGESSKIFCRRIFIEPIPQFGNEGDFSQESGHWLRVRSQVSWIGNGRSALRDFSQDGVDSANACRTDGDEWCTEQVTVLTDWRASND